MISDEDFLSLQFLVFSSHKTMTQSLSHTLNLNNLKTTHCHQIRDLGLTKEKFLELVRSYSNLNQRKLKIISIYRDPLDRFISSFFQSLSVERFGWTELGVEEKLNNFHASVLYSEQFSRLQERFWYYCAQFDRVDGAGESLDSISDIFNVQIDEIRYRKNGFTRNELTDINLYVSRFDILRQDFRSELSKLVGHELKDEQSANISDLKWYASEYKKFRQKILMPSFFIHNLYNSRRKLNDVFFPGLHERILAEKLKRYSLSAGALWRQRLASKLALVPLRRLAPAVFSGEPASRLPI